MKIPVYVLALCMLLTGTLNTLTTKFQDLDVIGYGPDGKALHFKHPAFQSACMFFGELLCFIPFLISEWQRARQSSKARYQILKPVRTLEFKIKRALAFAVPTFCDACGTTLLNVGLFYTFASTYQMLRGTLVLFAGTFTILILRRRLYLHHWMGMVLITAGAAIVGTASIIYSPNIPNSSPPLSLPSTATLRASSHLEAIFVIIQHPGILVGSEDIDSASAHLFGDICVVVAQGFTALQFILEEKFLKSYKVPALMAVGMEGAWGLLLCCIVLPIISCLKFDHGVSVDNAALAFKEVAASPQLLAAVVGSIISIAFFNFFGIRVTKALSGASRATIDATRTLFVWIACVSLGWETFHILQVVGFVVLCGGTSLYNDLLRLCLPAHEPVENPDDEEFAFGSPIRAASNAATSIQPGDASVSVNAGSLREPLLVRGADGQTPILIGSMGPGFGSVGPAPLPIASAGTSGAHGERSGPPTPNLVSSYEQYTMARSMRLGSAMFSPHSLVSFGMDGEGSEGERSDPGNNMASYVYNNNRTRTPPGSFKDQGADI